MSEWAAIEQIIPTPAMRARSNASQAAQISSEIRRAEILLRQIDRAQTTAIPNHPVGTVTSTLYTPSRASVYIADAMTVEFEEEGQPALITATAASLPPAIAKTAPVATLPVAAAIRTHDANLRSMPPPAPARPVAPSVVSGSAETDDFEFRHAHKVVQVSSPHAAATNEGDAHTLACRWVFNLIAK